MVSRQDAAVSRSRPDRAASVAGQHPAPQHGELAPERPVEHAVAHAHDHPAEDPWVGAEMGPHLLAQHSRQPLGDLLLEPAVRLGREDNTRVHAVQLQVEERLILLGDLPNQSLPAAPHDRLQEADERRRGGVAERLLEQPCLGGLRDPGRFQHDGDALVRLDRAGHRVEQPPVALDLALPLRRGGEEQRLRVVPRDGDALPRRCSRLARYSSARRLLASESRFCSTSRDAAAIERSTASRRSARIAFAFSSSMSFLARARCCSYSSRALASSVARSFSATAFALVTISCASARARSSACFCCSSRRAASSRACAASASWRSSRCSRSRTACSSTGHALRFRMKSSSPKTTSVQMTRPPSTVRRPPPPASSTIPTSA